MSDTPRPALPNWLLFLSAQCDGLRAPKRMQAALIEAADRIAALEAK